MRLLDKAETKAAVDGLNRLVKALGGWPTYFGRQEKAHGLSLLAQLRRDRVLDETVFGMVLRYAIHRAAFDAVSLAIKTAAKEALDHDEEVKPSGAGGFLTGDEQRQAYHENKLLTLERELLATPYARVRSGASAQTSFMDWLEKAPKQDGGDDKVTPFKPIGRHAGRRG